MNFLLVDDDIDDADLFCEALNKVNVPVNCLKAENGRRLFDVLSEHQADVIFLDINMPVMGGWDCLQRLKADRHYQQIPVIMYSTSSAKGDIETAYKSGASLFITKPEDFSELVEILEIVSTGLDEKQFSRLEQFKSVHLKNTRSA